MSSQLSIIEIKRTPHLLMIKTMILFLFHFLPIYNLCKHHFLCCSPYSIHLPYPKLRLLYLQRFRNSLLFCHLHYQYLHPLMRFPIYPVQMFIKLPLQHQHLIVRFSMLHQISFPKHSILSVTCFFILHQLQIRQIIIHALLYLKIILRGTAANGTFPIVSIFQSILPTKR